MSERGPKGDHGQHGDIGPTGLSGMQGERGSPGLEGDQGERGATGDVGQTGQIGQRGERGPANVRGYLAMGFAVAAGFAVFGTQVAENREQNQRLAAQTLRIEREGAARRDQTCLALENQHLASVKALRNTYRYLLALSPAERRQTINRFVIAGLPRVEQEAHTDAAPPYCDEPGVKVEQLWREGKPGGKPPVGRPEPDPVIPDRPAALR